MGLNIKNERVERLAEEVARLTGETKTAAILRALEERRQRLALQIPPDRQRDLTSFMEREIWPHVPKRLIGRGVSRSERERILGYGKHGV